MVVVGASIAGCTTARLFALAGARVALIERHPDPAAYLVVGADGRDSTVLRCLAADEVDVRCVAVLLAERLAGLDVAGQDADV